MSCRIACRRTLALLVGVVLAVVVMPAGRVARAADNAGTGDCLPGSSDCLSVGTGGGGTGVTEPTVPGGSTPPESSGGTSSGSTAPSTSVAGSLECAKFGFSGTDCYAMMVAYPAGTLTGDPKSPCAGGVLIGGLDAAPFVPGSSSQTAIWACPPGPAVTIKRLGVWGPKEGLQANVCLKEWVTIYDGVTTVEPATECAESKRVTRKLPCDGKTHTLKLGFRIKLDGDFDATWTKNIFTGEKADDVPDPNKIFGMVTASGDKTCTDETDNPTPTAVRVDAPKAWSADGAPVDATLVTANADPSNVLARRFLGWDGAVTVSNYPTNEWDIVEGANGVLTHRFFYATDTMGGGKVSGLRSPYQINGVARYEVIWDRSTSTTVTTPGACKDGGYTVWKYTPGEIVPSPGMYVTIDTYQELWGVQVKIGTETVWVRPTDSNWPADVPKTIQLAGTWDDTWFERSSDCDPTAVSSTEVQNVRHTRIDLVPFTYSIVVVEPKQSR